LEVGRFSYGIDEMEIREWGEGANLRIGAFCSIARGVQVFLGGNHRTDWITTYPFGHIFADQLGGEDITGHPRTKGDVIIGNDVWIGENVTLMSGVSIADGTVVAANATVSKSTQPYEIWAGNPARRIKPRFDANIVEALMKLRWWDLPIERIREIAPLLSQPPSAESIEKLRTTTQNER